MKSPSIYNVRIVQLGAPLAAWGGQEADIQAKNRKLASLFLQTGGVTFVAYMSIGALGLLFSYIRLELDSFYISKLTCLITNIAWYWILASEEMRNATGRLFFNLS